MTYQIEGRTGSWEVVIGLEVHAQVITKSKLFSGASTAFGSDPNANVSLVDAAMPGMLPVINKAAVRQAIRTGLGLNAKINTWSRFDRKNYFYADLPQGYQISQYQYPIVGEGHIDIDLEHNRTKLIGIERLHLEQDAGKSIHDMDPKLSYVDLTRSGVALMEIVSQPDINSPEEAAAYISKLRMIMRYLGACDGNMEEGSMRADVNISVRRPGDQLGTRCEIKNVNSIRFMRQAIEYEARRQIEIIEDGGTIDQETRLFDANRIETRPMRSKENAHDYRYFPDPDLLPLVLDEAEIAEIRSNMPELPDAKKVRFIEDFGLTPYDAGVLIAEEASAVYFEKVAAGRDAKLTANWVINELFAQLKRIGLGIADSPVSADTLGGLIDLIKDGTISGRTAKEVFETMIESGKSADEIVESRGLKQISDEAEIEALIDGVLNANPDKVEQYRAGKDKLFGFFVGQTMKATGGKANPTVVNALLKAKLAT